MFKFIFGPQSWNLYMKPHMLDCGFSNSLAHSNTFYQELVVLWGKPMRKRFTLDTQNEGEEDRQTHTDTTREIYIEKPCWRVAWFWRDGFSTADTSDLWDEAKKNVTDNVRVLWQWPTSLICCAVKENNMIRKKNSMKISFDVEWVNTWIPIGLPAISWQNE